MEREDILEESVLTVSTENIGTGADSTITSSFFDTPKKSPVKSPRREGDSLIKWFDRSVEMELAKRRNDPMSPSLNISGQSGLKHPLFVESSVSGIDIAARLRSEQDTDLLDAVDKLAKAEAMVAFEGAVKAAEEAAASAPPEYAEEAAAAAANARSFQAELTSVVKEVLPGIRPIEVVGYVGITKPKNPRKF